MPIYLPWPKAKLLREIRIENNVVPNASVLGVIKKIHSHRNHKLEVFVSGFFLKKKKTEGRVHSLEMTGKKQEYLKYNDKSCRKEFHVI